MTNEKQFTEQFERLREWIRSSVSVFADDSEEAKQARISRCETDKIFFAETYFPHYCTDPFAPMHKEMFKFCDITFTPQVIAGFRESAKSTIMSTIDIIHKIVYRKRRFIEIVSSSEDNATEFTIPIQAEFLHNPRLLNDFGDQRTDYWGFNDMVFKTGTRLLALGPKMKVKGRRHREARPDHIIIEDIEDRNSPQNPKVIRRMLRWLTTDLLKSVNSKMWSFIFIGNYYSKRTLIHRLITDPQFKHWKKKVYSATYTDSNGKLHASWPARFPVKKLKEEEALDPIAYRSEMKQKPEDEDGTFNEEWIQYYTPEEIDGLELITFTFVDPSANSAESKTGCYKAIIVASLCKELMTYYIRHAWIRKESKLRMTNKHFDLSLQYSSIMDGVEAVGFQKTLKEDYERIEGERLKHIPIKLMPQHENKIERIARHTSTMERGKIKFMRGHSDQNLLIEQFLDFPEGFIDGPDALTSLIDMAESKYLKLKRKSTARVLGG